MDWILFDSIPFDENNLYRSESFLPLILFSCTCVGPVLQKQLEDFLIAAIKDHPLVAPKGAIKALIVP